MSTIAATATALATALARTASRRRRAAAVGSPAVVVVRRVVLLEDDAGLRLERHRQQRRRTVRLFHQQLLPISYLYRSTSSDARPCINSFQQRLRVSCWLSTSSSSPPDDDGGSTGDKSLDASSSCNSTSSKSWTWEEAFPEVAHWNVHPDLRQYVRPNLTTTTTTTTTTTIPSSASTAATGHEILQQQQLQNRLKDDNSVPVDTGMAVVLLGTGAGGPSLERNNPSTAIKMAGTTYLFDAGEGVQVPLMKSRIKRSSITKVFVTHLHGDHVLGLPGLLLALQINAKAQIQDPNTNQRKERQRQQRWEQLQNRHAAANGGDEALSSTLSSPALVPALPEPSPTRLLQLYGPEGLYEYVTTVLRLIHADLHFLKVEVHELVKGMGRTAVPSSSMPPTSTLPGAGMELLTPSLRRNLIRKVVPQDPDGTWTLETPYECTTAELAERASSSSGGRGVYVHAAEVRHLPRLTCLGYVVREPTTQPCRIDRAKATAAGIRPGKKYERLKYGFPVASDADPNVLVHPHQVLASGPRPSRSVAILGDCFAVPGPMSELCKNVDVLVHEATLKDDPERHVATRRGTSASRAGGGPSSKAKKVGHSTAEMAGRVAKRLQPKVLLLNHLSASLRDHDLAKAAERQLLRNDGSSSGSESDVRRRTSVDRTGPIASLDPRAPPDASVRTKVQVGYDHLEIMVPIDGFPW